MTFECAKEYAKEGIKITHAYFADNEYLTMKGNLIIFEDGAKIFASEWLADKEWAVDGWVIYKENK